MAETRRQGVQLKNSRSGLQWSIVCVHLYMLQSVPLCATFRESGRNDMANSNSNNGPQIFANVTVNWHNVARDAHAATRAVGLFISTPFSPYSLPPIGATSLFVQICLRIYSHFRTICQPAVATAFAAIKPAINI